VTLASDPFAPPIPAPGSGGIGDWLANLGEGLQSTVTVVAVAAVALAAVILYKR
jgi:hypothetical protein